jgi:hypothetical protein
LCLPKDEARKSAPSDRSAAITNAYLDPQMLLLVDRNGNPHQPVPGSSDPILLRISKQFVGYFEGPYDNEADPFRRRLEVIHEPVTLSSMFTLSMELAPGGPCNKD